MSDWRREEGGNADSTEPTGDAAERAIAGFQDLSSEIRGCAILGPAGILAASGEREGWHEAATALLDAADEAAGGGARQAHVATEDGEAYAVRFAGLAMVAVTDRFSLASLVLADMRATLRLLARGAAQELAEAA